MGETRPSDISFSSYPRCDKYKFAAISSARNATHPKNPSSERLRVRFAPTTNGGLELAYRLASTDANVASLFDRY